MKSSLYIFLLMLSVAALAEPSEEELANYTTEAERVSKQLVFELGATLKQELQSSGPEAAVKVCAELAPTITNQLSIENGYRVTRVGTKVRNPLLGTADRWEQEAFDYFEKNISAGKKLETLSYSAISDEPSGKFYRYMKPLGVKPVCQVCHGDADKVPASIKTKYPHDMATGYKVGQLRGGVSIKRRLTTD